MAKTGPKPVAPEIRFWRHVQKTAGCWYWTGALYKNGYGVFNVKGITGYAHRFAWLMQNGALPKGLFVCHHCDIPRCVRPEHLFLGTPKDNTQDSRKKGRLKGPDTPSRGSKHYCAKLTPSDVTAIRTRLNLTDRELATHYGVAPATIYYVRTRRSWKHIS